MPDHGSPLDRLDELMRSMTPEHCAELDAQIRAEEADPNYVPPRVEWREDPDPFGMDWLWLYRADAAREPDSEVVPRPGCGDLSL